MKMGTRGPYFHGVPKFMTLDLYSSKYDTCAYTIYPQNLAAVKFDCKALFDVVTIWEHLDFKGSVYRDRHACVCIASIMSLFVCMYNVCAHMHIVVDPVPCSGIFRGRFLGWVGWNNIMWWHFEGGGISRCSEISGSYFWHMFLRENQGSSNTISTQKMMTYSLSVKKIKYSMQATSISASMVMERLVGLTPGSTLDTITRIVCIY